MGCYDMPRSCSFLTSIKPAWITVWFPEDKAASTIHPPTTAISHRSNLISIFGHNSHDFLMKYSSPAGADTNRKSLQVS
jgi:hypothetical protein